ncbi:MAG: hypothetical protein JWO05_3420 [Gemmatimonadetes bacterium]|nr:hypothetical protein [Gemmatimonadota bacterium]
MCGRVTRTDPKRIEAELRRLAAIFSAPMPIEPRYNVPPGDVQLVVREVRDDATAAREAAWLKWGLVPFWAKEPSIGNRLVNARCEGAADKPAFRDAMKRRRCLFVVDGFYEWRKNASGPKTPFYFHREDGAPFTLGGLYERWLTPGGEPLDTCVVLTTAPNALMQPVHERMPVIVRPEDQDRWLDPDLRDPAQLGDIVAPSDPNGFAAHAVSRRVNIPSADDASLIELEEELRLL